MIFILTYLSLPGCSTTEGIWINTKGWKGSHQNDCRHDCCLCFLLGTIHFLCLLCSCYPWLCLSPPCSSHACILCKECHNLQSHYLCLYEPTGNNWNHFCKCLFSLSSVTFLYWCFNSWKLKLNMFSCLVVPVMHHATLWKEGWWWLWSVLYLKNRSLLCGTCINIFWLMTNGKDFRTLNFLISSLFITL